MDIFRSINRMLHRLLGYFCVIILGVLVLDVVLGVISRYLTGGQIRWTEELAVLLLVWLVFLGSALAYRDDVHLGIDLLVKNLDPKTQETARIIGNGIVLIFILTVLVGGGLQLTWDRYQSGQIMSTLGTPKALLYLSIPTSGFFMLTFNIEKLFLPKREAISTHT